MFRIDFKLKCKRKMFKETLFGKIDKRKNFVFYRFGLLGEFKAVMKNDIIYTEDDFTKIGIINNFLTENSVWKLSKIEEEIELESVDYTLTKKINKFKFAGFKIKKGRRIWLEK